MTELTAIGSRIDGILFRSFWNQNWSQKNTIAINSMYSQSGIVPKEFDQMGFTLLNVQTKLQFIFHVFLVYNIVEIVV